MNPMHEASDGFLPEPTGRSPDGDGPSPRTQGDPLAGVVDDPRQVDEKYLTIFADETEANLRGFVDLLLCSPEERDDDLVARLMHKAHQIKGCAAVVGCSRVAAVAHAMEDVLQNRIDGSLALSETMVGALLECTDETSAFLERLRRGEFGEDGFSDAVRRLLEADGAVDTARENDLTETRPGETGHGEKTPEETPCESRVREAMQPGMKGYTGRIVFRQGLPLSNYKAQLIHEKLRNACEVAFFRPAAETLEDIESVSEIRFGVVGDLSTDEVAACVRVGGVADWTVEPVESPHSRATERTAPAENPEIKPRASRTLRVETRQLDHLMGLAGRLIVNRAKLAQSADSLRQKCGYNEDVRRLDAAVDELTYISDDIRKAVTDTRMVPIEPLFNLFRRVLRDNGDASGKRIRLEMRGADTRLDKQLIDELGDPLIHLVRNAVDHGIETPEERLRLGKEPEGTLCLEAFQEGHDVAVRVKDDGRGLDTARIRRRAVERGLVDEEEAKVLGDAEIADFIWKSGFSTAHRVTSISGRGVGMDIVRRTIERLGGTIDTSSTAGQGCAFTIRLPLTLAVVRGLLMETGGEIHAVPTKSVVEVFRVPRDEAGAIPRRRFMRFRGEPLGVVGVDEFLGLQNREPDDRPLTVVVLSRFNRRIGLLVGRVVGEQNLVIQSITRNYGTVAEISGAGVLGDGGLALILDIAALFAKYTEFGRAERAESPPTSTHLASFHVGKDVV